MGPFGGFAAGAALVALLWRAAGRRGGDGATAPGPVEPAAPTSPPRADGTPETASAPAPSEPAPSEPTVPAPAEAPASDDELARVTAELEQARAELSEARVSREGAQADMVNAAKMAALGQLVAGVAHEINTPMGALNSNHDVIRRALDKLQVILEDERVDEDELEEVRRIVKAVDGVQATNAMAVERMGHIVRSLRTFGRPDRSEVGPLELGDALDSTLVILAHEVRGRIEVIRDYEPIPPVDCYPNRINQVFMNLLMNACQAIPESGTITVTIRMKNPDTAVVEITDTGVGIGPEALDKIFEPGFTTKGERIGMGMGLLISRQIVEQHTGSLTATSTLGKGTTFTLELPIRLSLENAASGA